LTLRSREARSSWLELTNRTALRGVSRAGGMFAPIHLLVCRRLSGTLPPDRKINPPRLAGCGGSLTPSCTDRDPAAPKHGRDDCLALKSRTSRPCGVRRTTSLDPMLR
jgi:hypothetical protein